MNLSGNQRRTFMSTRVCIVMGKMLIDPRRFGTPTCSPVWSQLTAWKLSSVPVANAQVGSSRSRLTCGVKGERERMAGSTSAAPTGVGWEADSQSPRQHQVLANSSGIVPRHKSQAATDSWLQNPAQHARAAEQCEWTQPSVAALAKASKPASASAASASKPASASVSPLDVLGGGSK